MAAVSASGDVVVIRVWLVPGASRSGIQGIHGDHVKIRVTSPPEDGRANREVARILEERLGVTARLVRGMKGRSKVFEVTGADADYVRGKLRI